MTDADLLQALRDCYDPLLRRNVVELNLVRSARLEVDPDAPGVGIAGVPSRYRASVTLTAPGADEAANAQLVAQIQNRLAGMQEISHVDVQLVPPAFPILNARKG
jgi:metal-sulfur cluster biosynthetic enzyme